MAVGGLLLDPLFWVVHRHVGVGVGVVCGGGVVWVVREVEVVGGSGSGGGSG